MAPGSALSGFLAGAWVTYACMVVSERTTGCSPKPTAVQSPANTRHRRHRTRYKLPPLSKEDSALLEADLEADLEPEPEPEPAPAPAPEHEPLAAHNKANRAAGGANDSEGHGDKDALEWNRGNSTARAFRAWVLGAAVAREDRVSHTSYNRFLTAFIRDVVVTARNCRICENFIKRKKGKRKTLLNGTVSCVLREIKMAPNSATDLAPVVEFLGHEKWRSDVPVYPSTTKQNRVGVHGTNEQDNSEGAPGNLKGMWGSQWKVKWSVPVDVDMKIDYEGHLLTSMTTDGSLYVSMRELMIEAEPWIFVDATADGVRAVVVHFETIPTVNYELSGELRSSNAAAATAKRALVWTAAQWTGKSEWDHAMAFVRENIVNKLLLEHTASRAVSYQIGVPDELDSAEQETADSASQLVQHYRVGELFRTTTRNTNLVSMSPRTPPVSP